MMTEREAGVLLDLLRRAYPTSEPHVDSYVEALTRHRSSFAVAASAVRSWVVNESWLPKLNELLEAIENEQTTRAADVDRRALGAGNVLPPGVAGGLSTDKGALYVALVRRALSEQLGGEHRHHIGAAGCPRCARGDEQVAGFVARMYELIDEHRDELIDDGAVETFMCGQCHDVGFVDDGVIDGQTIWRPCPCRPDVYDRWRGGHFGINHDCAECHAARKGRRAAA